MLQIPLLRAGRAYSSLTTQRLTDVRTGETVAEVSLANPGLIVRELAHMAENQASLAALSVVELLEICRRAGEYFLHGELPVGEARQSADDYLAQLTGTTGMPISLGRANMKKIHFVLDQMGTVLAGLTRGLDPGVLDAGWGMEGERCVSFRRETEALGVVLPSNSPGVHSLWLPAIALQVPLVLKPGSQEPWTPLRVAQALLAAGCPAAALSFLPTDYSGAAEILLRCGRSMLFGDRSTVEPWRADPRVQIHGPGWSKVIIGPDQAPSWQRYLDLIVESVTTNCGRSCINASGVWSTDNSYEIAQGLAQRLAAIEARPLADPAAQLAAFPDARVARQLSDHIDAQLRVPGATDLTAPLRPTGRVVEVDGCTFLLPTVVHCDDPDHPLARAEFLFPFVTVVEVPEEDLVDRLGPTLVASAITDRPELRRRLMTASHVDRLNLGPIATCAIAWDQPHEGNLFEHLYRQRAFQGPERPAEAGVPSQDTAPGAL